VNLSDPRNPVFIPTSEANNRIRGCPKCGSADFDGRRVGGSVKFTCGNKDCKQKWTGGLPQVPVDPSKPQMPENPKNRPTVFFDPVMNPKTKTLEFREETRAPDESQNFRRGLIVPDAEDY
jgi:hypothetical protein